MKTIKDTLSTALLHGEIDKWTYIEKMYDQHIILFDYTKGIADTNISQIELTDGHVIMTTRDNGIRLEASEKDERCVPIEMLNFGDYEKDEWDIMIEILKEAQVCSFFDIGANMGYISLLLKKKMPDIKVTGFEPIEKTYELFKRNVELNQTDVNAVHMGLSNEEGLLTYYYYPEGSGNASLKNLSGRENVEEIQTPVTTLDKYVKTHDIKSIDFMKIDVEGAELNVIGGGIDTIENFKPIMYVELLRKWSEPFGYAPNDVVKLLAGKGYGCYVINAGRIVEIDRIDDETKETNFVFLHREKHNKIIDTFQVSDDAS